MLANLIQGTHANALATIGSHLATMRSLLLLVEDSDSDDVARYV